MDNTPPNNQLDPVEPPRIASPDQPTTLDQNTAPSEYRTFQRKTSSRGALRELLETAVIVLVVFVLIRGVVQNFRIDGPSMEPSFYTDELILVNKIVYFHVDLNAPMRLLGGDSTLPEKLVYPFHMPRRGEVIVFQYPRDPSKDYIKRVIGLPGDTVVVRDGQVYVNNALLDEPYLQGTQTACNFTDPCAQNQPVVVPPGSLFVMGDNRPNSSDSREWSELPLDLVIGKAWVVYWPYSKWRGVSTPTYSQP